MKTILSLLAVACLGFAAIGCDPAPKDEPATTSTPLKAEKSSAPSVSAKPDADRK